MYTPPETRAYEGLVAAMARQARPKGWPTSATYCVVVDFYMAGHRADGDNLLKSLLDGCQGILWANDKQVVESTVRLKHDIPGMERAEVSVTLRED